MVPYMAMTDEEWRSWLEQLKRDFRVLADKYEYRGDDW